MGVFREIDFLKIQFHEFCLFVYFLLMMFVYIFFTQEPFWIPLLTIVYFVLADTTSNLTREPAVTNAHQIPPLQQKGLDLQMIVLISKLFFSWN